MKNGLMSGGTPGGAAAPSTPPIFSRGPGGILPERGSQRQIDLVSQLLQAGMSSAQQSGNPLLALLAPVASSAIASRTTGLYDTAQKERTDAATESLVGLMGGNPKAAELIKVINNPQTPDHLKSIASTMVGKIINPPRGRQPAARKIREDVNGIARYLDTGEQVFPGVEKTPTANAGASRQYNEATRILSSAITDLQSFGYTPEEASEMVRNDPLYARQWEMVDGVEERASPAPSTRVETPVVPTTPLAKPQAPPPPPPGTVEF